MLFAGYCILLLAWAVGNPPGASADETYHYIKALGVAHGEFWGEALPVARRETEAAPRGVDASRLFQVPSALWSPSFSCNAFDPRRPASCLSEDEEARSGSGQTTKLLSPAGTYQPYLYSIAGLAARTAGDPTSGFYFARFGQLALNILLIGLSITSVKAGKDPDVALVGLLLALTPMAISLAASVNPSGPEIMGSVCCFAAVLRIKRSEGASGWFAGSAGASALVLSRPPGVIWLAFIALAVLVIYGPNTAARLVKEGRPRSFYALGATGLVLVLTVATQLVVQPAPFTRNPSEFASFLSAFSELRSLTKEAIGVFGWLDTSMPFLAYSVWLFLGLTAILLAWLVGKRQHRQHLGLLCLGVPLVSASLSALLFRPWGLGRQGRYFLPIAATIPLLSAEILRESRSRLGKLWPNSFPRWVASGVGTVHLVAWWSNSRRHSVGTNGPILFLMEPRWVPPGGWFVWSVAALLGSLLIALSASSAPGRRGVTIEREGG